MAKSSSKDGVHPYLRIESWLPPEKCKEEKDGVLRYWPKHLDEHYRKSYPELHRQIDNFKRI